MILHICIYYTSVLINNLLKKIWWYMAIVCVFCFLGTWYSTKRKTMLCIVSAKHPNASRHPSRPGRWILFCVSAAWPNLQVWLNLHRPTGSVVVTCVSLFQMVWCYNDVLCIYIYIQYTYIFNHRRICFFRLQAPWKLRNSVSTIIYHKAPINGSCKMLQPWFYIY